MACGTLVLWPGRNTESHRALVPQCSVLASMTGPVILFGAF